MSLNSMLTLMSVIILNKLAWTELKSRHKSGTHNYTRTVVSRSTVFSVFFYICLCSEERGEVVGGGIKPIDGCCEVGVGYP